MDPVKINHPNEYSLLTGCNTIIPQCQDHLDSPGLLPYTIVAASTQVSPSMWQLILFIINRIFTSTTPLYMYMCKLPSSVIVSVTVFQWSLNSSCVVISVVNYHSMHDHKLSHQHVVTNYLRRKFGSLVKQSTYLVEHTGCWVIGLRVCRRPFTFVHAEIVHCWVVA